MSNIIKSSRSNWKERPDPVFIVETQDDPQSISGDSADAVEPAGPSPEEIAQQIIANAENQAQQLVSNAKSQVAQLEQSAYHAGYTQGMTECEARWQDEYARLQQEQIRLQQEWEQIIDAAEPELVKLSIEIAQKVIKQEITQSPELVLNVVRSALIRVKDKEVRILVNPDDIELLKEARASLIGDSEGVSEIDFVSERRVGQGGCILETPSGNLDARLDTQLEHIREMITKGQDDESDHVE